MAIKQAFSAKKLKSVGIMTLDHQIHACSAYFLTCTCDQTSTPPLNFIVFSFYDLKK